MRLWAFIPLGAVLLAQASASPSVHNRTKRQFEASHCDPAFCQIPVRWHGWWSPKDYLFTPNKVCPKKQSFCFIPIRFSTWRTRTSFRESIERLGFLDTLLDPWRSQFSGSYHQHLYNLSVPLGQYIEAIFSRDANTWLLVVWTFLDNLARKGVTWCCVY